MGNTYVNQKEITSPNTPGSMCMRSACADAARKDTTMFVASGFEVSAPISSRL